VDSAVAESGVLEISILQVSNRIIYHDHLNGLLSPGFGTSSFPFRASSNAVDECTNRRCHRFGASSDKNLSSRIVFCSFLPFPAEPVCPMKRRISRIR
jgi:hypothetical protein